MNRKCTFSIVVIFMLHSDAYEFYVLIFMKPPSLKHICWDTHTAQSNCPSIMSQLDEVVFFQLIIKNDRPAGWLLPTAFVFVLRLSIMANLCKETGMFDVLVLFALWIFSEACPLKLLLDLFFILFIVTHAKWSLTQRGNTKNSFGTSAIPSPVDHVLEVKISFFFLWHTKLSSCRNHFFQH